MDDRDALPTFLLRRRDKHGLYPEPTHYRINDTVDLGPQAEAVYLFDGIGLVSFIIGGRINIAYGENNTLGVLVGYDLEKGEDDTGITGRLSFTRNW